MPPPRIGVDIQDLRAPTKDALRLAADLGFQAIEAPTAEGDTVPQNLSSSGRRHLRRIVDGLGLDFAALTADFPGLRFTDPQTVDERVNRSRAAIELACEMRVPIVTASVVAMTHPQSGEPSDVAMAALRAIGEFADSRGVIFAIRPSHDGRDRLLRVQNELRCPSVRLALDPAALVMSGIDPSSCVGAFAGGPALIHLRDALAGMTDRPGQETQFGEGSVNFSALMESLRSADFAGSYVVRRLDSANPLHDLALARERAIGYVASH